MYTPKYNRMSLGFLDFRTFLFASVKVGWERLRADFGDEAIKAVSSGTLTAALMQRVPNRMPEGAR